MKTNEKNATIHVGEHALLVNNQWGEKRLAEGDKYTQTIGFKEKILNGHPFWRWNCQTEQPGVKGFPSLLYGKNPWREGGANPENPPRSVWYIDSNWRTLLQLDLDYAARVSAEGTWNLLLDVWIVQNGKARPEDITDEIMIVLAGTKPAWPRAVIEPIQMGQVSARTTSAYWGGRSWNARQYRHHTGRWNCILFRIGVGHDHRLHGVLPIHECLEWCVRWCGLKGFLASVELGTEIVSGTGTAVLERYDIEWR
ncbi:MAG: hypothetical protein ACE5D3_02450 [Candidatus Binatia bacterium]